MAVVAYEDEGAEVTGWSEGIERVHGYTNALLGGSHVRSRAGGHWTI